LYISCFHLFFISLFIISFYVPIGASGSVVGWSTMLQATKSRVRDAMTVHFSIDLIHPAALALGVQSASNRSEYKKQKKKFLWIRARPACKGSQSHRHPWADCLDCGILNISQPYRTSRTVKGIDLLFFQFASH
jgi:hypothetical protein